jgi:hypothetical protein
MFRSNGYPDGFRSKSRIEGPAALIWRLGQVKHAPVCEWNLFKIDHLLIVPPDEGICWKNDCGRFRLFMPASGRPIRPR